MDPIRLLTNCTVFSTVRQEDDEAAWLAARTHGIGGSDVGPICGVSPFTSARQVYLRKTGQFDEPSGKGNAASERMYFGHVLEPVVADEYVKRTGAKVVTVDATLAHKDNPWALANIDRLIVDDDGKPIGILECKTTSEYMNDEWESGEILMSYIYQLNWYLWILGLERGAFACLVGGNKFYHYDVFRNDELLNDTIIPAAKSFWFDNVLALVDPPLQATDTDYVSDKYAAVSKGSEVLLPEDSANDLAETVCVCKAKIKELEKTMTAAQNCLKEHLQDKEIGRTKDYIIKWSQVNQSRVDTTALKTNYPEVYEKVLTQKAYRRFTVQGGDL